MADDARIEELRRRVQKDPASIAFAQLAEELRRSARFLEAVEGFRAGLEMYPGYLSVRVTLGRCLIELDRVDDAERELEQVRSSAPENLAAIRALSQIHQRRRGASGARPDGGDVQSAGEVRLKPDVTGVTQRSDLRPTPTAVDRPHSVEVPATRRGRAVNEDEYIRIVRTLAALEAWLTAIHVTRASRGA